ncbi:hypothetical protein BDV18DRAFT_37116 [Aspergillus unguis]
MSQRVSKAQRVPEAQNVSKPRKVAIIGGGLTGVVSYWALQNSCLDVHLFEATSSLGGHMKTWLLEGNGRQILVDRELPTFNPKACPNMLSLLRHLGVSSSPAPFSFGVEDETSMFKWQFCILTSIILDPRMLCKLETYRLILDAIYLRFIGPGIDETEILKSTAEYLSENGYSDNFRDKYLIPLLSTLWRTNAGRFLRSLPIGALLYSLSSHQLFSTCGTMPDWLRIDRGVRYFIKALTRDFAPENQHLETKVNEIVRCPKSKSHYHLATSSGEYCHFDHIILAIDGPEILRLLGSSVTDKEEDVLQCLGVTRNLAVLHSNLMRTSDNTSPGYNSVMEYRDHRRQDDPPRSCLESNVNMLQDLHPWHFGNVFITINAVSPPRVNHVCEVWEFTEPEPSTESLLAQSRLTSIQNTRGLSYGFCWTGRGPLEDSVTSGLRMAVQDLGATVPFEVVFHPHPLRSTNLPHRRSGIRYNLLKTILEAFHVLLLFLELMLIQWNRAHPPGSDIRASLRLFWPRRTEAAHAHKN